MQLFSNLKEKITEYADIKIRLYQLSLEERIVKLASKILYLVCVTGIGLLCLVFSFVFLAKTLSRLTHSELIGYGSVSALCLCMLGLLTRDKFQLAFTNTISNKLYSTLKETQHGNESTPGI